MQLVRQAHGWSFLCGDREMIPVLPCSTVSLCLWQNPLLRLTLESVVGYDWQRQQGCKNLSLCVLAQALHDHVLQDLVGQADLHMRELILQLQGYVPKSLLPQIGCHWRHLVAS